MSSITLKSSVVKKAVLETKEYIKYSRKRIQKEYKEKLASLSWYQRWNSEENINWSKIIKLVRLSTIEDNAILLGELAEVSDTVQVSDKHFYSICKFLPKITNENNYSN